jgi:hypothetical protein
MMRVDKNVMESLLVEYTTYDKETGKLFWKKSPSARAPVGKEVGSLVDGYFYSQITFGGKRYRFPVHKAIWFWLYGEYPDSIIDHKDMNRSNNSPDNLRKASRSENNRNRFYNKGTSKYQGVYLQKSTGNYVVQITFDKKNTKLGSYRCETKAAMIYDKAAREKFGDFAYQNFKPRGE